MTDGEKARKAFHNCYGTDDERWEAAAFAVLEDDDWGCIPAVASLLFFSLGIAWLAVGLVFAGMLIWETLT